MLSQADSFDADVQKKLSMLESGDIFTDPNRYVQEILKGFSAYQTDYQVSSDGYQTEDALENAFEASFATPQQPQSQYVPQPQQQYGQPQYVQRQQPQYNQPQYNQPQYAPQPQTRPQPQVRIQPQYAQPQYNQQPQQTSADNAELSANIEDRKKSLAAKIAALRGISMPGDYLNANKPK